MGCKAVNECLFPHQKVDEQPNKKPKKSYHSHKGRESDDKTAVAIVKIVPQLGCVSQDSDILDSQRGRQSWGNRMQKVLGSIRKVRFTQSTLRQASIRENKGPSLGNIQVKNPHQRSPYGRKFENNSDAPEARRGTLPKTFTNSMKKTRLHSTRPRKNWVLPVAEARTGGKRVFGRFRS